MLQNITVGGTEQSVSVNDKEFLGFMWDCRMTLYLSQREY